MRAGPALETALDPVVRWLVPGTPLPGDVEQAARCLLLDTLGCAVAGGAKPEIADLGAHLALIEPGPVDIPGLEPGLSVSAAAYLLALAACWDEACEGLARAHGRPGLHTIPAVVALASGRQRSAPFSVGAVLAAVVAGYEVAGRLGEVLRIRPGMHVDGTWGSVGGAVGAGHLLGVDASTSRRIVEATACQLPWSQYLPVAAGATARNLYVAEASARAIRTVLAVMAGVTTPAGAVTGYAEGALALTDPGPVAPPGEWLILQGYLKPFAAVRHVHYGVACALALAEDGLNVEEIDSIRLDVYPEAITYCGNRAPTSAIQAQFSLSYGLAHALVHGDLSPDAYSDDSLADPTVRRLETIVSVEPLPDDGNRRAKLTVATGGTSRTVERTAVLGDPGWPMSTGDVVAKFERYAMPTLAHGKTDRLVELVIDAPLDEHWLLDKP